MRSRVQKGPAKKKASPVPLTTGASDFLKEPIGRRHPRIASKERLEANARVAKKFKSWRPSTEVLTKVRAHRTIFCQLDRATRVNGWPLERIELIHGPSNHGKTALLHGIGLSFLRAGNFYALIDAERTTSAAWLEQLMAEHASNPGFIAMRPNNYEEAVIGVREFVDGVLEAKAKKQLPEEATGFIGVDSIRKLVPENLLMKIIAEEGGIDGAKGRAAMMKAALTGQWLDELVPLMHRAGLTIAFITRESKNVNKKTKFDADYVLQGGEGVKFESSLTSRVMRSGWITDGPQDKPRVIGEKHSIRITKTKIGGKDGRDSVAYFHTSNGTLYRAGFDRGRDVLDLGLRLGVIEQSGAHYSYAGEKIGNGQHAAARLLNENEELCEDIAAKLELGEGEVLSDSEEASEETSE